MDEWRALLDSLTYRPGWKFELRGDDLELALVIRLTDVQDTYSERRIMVMHRYPLPLFFREDYAQRWLRDCIHRTECHESDEWIRFNGEMVFNPHRNDS